LLKRRPSLLAICSFAQFAPHPVEPPGFRQWNTRGLRKNRSQSNERKPQCLQSPHYHGPLAKVTNAKFGENDTIPNQLCDRGRGEKFLATPKTARQSVDRVIEIRPLFGSINSQRWRIATPFREQLVAKPLSGWRKPARASLQNANRTAHDWIDNWLSNDNRMLGWGCCQTWQNSCPYTSLHQSKCR
jgi:hypothetical protein